MITKMVSHTDFMKYGTSVRFVRLGQQFLDRLDKQCDRCFTLFLSESTNENTFSFVGVRTSMMCDVSFMWFPLRVVQLD